MRLADYLSGQRSFVFPHEAAHMLRLSTTSVRRLCTKGLLLYEVTPGGHRRIVGGLILRKVQLVKKKVYDNI